MGPSPSPSAIPRVVNSMYIGKLRQIASSNAALGLLLTLVLGLVILLAYVKFLEWNYKRIHKNGVKLTVKHPDVWLPDGPALAQHFVGTYATIHVSTPKPEPGERVRLMYLGEPQVDASVQPRLVLEEQVVQTTNFAGDLVFGPLPHVGNYEAQYVGSSKPLLGRVAGIYETLREWRLLSWLLNRQGELWVIRREPFTVSRPRLEPPKSVMWKDPLNFDVYTSPARFVAPTFISRLASCINPFSGSKMDSILLVTVDGVMVPLSSQSMPPIPMSSALSKTPEAFFYGKALAAGGKPVGVTGEVGHPLFPAQVVSSLYVPSGGPRHSLVLKGESAPQRKGTYFLLYVRGDNDESEVVAVSDAIDVTGPTLTPNVTAYDDILAENCLWGKPVSVAVTANVTRSARSLLGFAVVCGDVIELVREPDAREIDVIRGGLEVPDGVSSFSLEFNLARAPPLPGSYHFEFLEAGRLSLGVSPSFTVRGPSIEVLPANAHEPRQVRRYNEPVKIGVRASRFRTAYDYIELVYLRELDGDHRVLPPAVAPKSVRYPVPTPKDLAQQLKSLPGIVDGERFEMCVYPGYPGLYEVRYVVMARKRSPPGLIADAITQPFEVLGPVLTFLPSTHLAPRWGEALSVSYELSQALESTKGAYIALAPKDKPALVTNQWFVSLSGRFMMVPDEGHIGKLHFEQDKSAPGPGEFQFALFTPIAPDGAIVELARSASFLVGGPTLTSVVVSVDYAVGSNTCLPPVTQLQGTRLLVEFTTSHTHSAQDWIGIARRGGQPNTGDCAGLYHYVPKGGRGLVLFDETVLPKVDGEFEFCYINSKTELVIARGGVFENAGGRVTSRSGVGRLIRSSSQPTPSAPASAVTQPETASGHPVRVPDLIVVEPSAPPAGAVYTAVGGAGGGAQLENRADQEEAWDAEVEPAIPVPPPLPPLMGTLMHSMFPRSSSIPASSTSSPASEPSPVPLGLPPLPIAQSDAVETLLSSLTSTAPHARFLTMLCAPDPKMTDDVIHTVLQLMSALVGEYGDVFRACSVSPAEMSRAHRFCVLAARTPRLADKLEIASFLQSLSDRFEHVRDDCIELINICGQLSVVTDGLAPLAPLLSARFPVAASSAPLASIPDVTSRYFSASDLSTALAPVATAALEARINISTAVLTSLVHSGGRLPEAPLLPFKSRVEAALGEMEHVLGRCISELASASGDPMEWRPYATALGPAHRAAEQKVLEAKGLFVTFSSKFGDCLKQLGAPATAGPQVFSDLRQFCDAYAIAIAAAEREAAARKQAAAAVPPPVDSLLAQITARPPLRKVSAAPAPAPAGLDPNSLAAKLAKRTQGVRTPVWGEGQPAAAMGGGGGQGKQQESDSGSDSDAGDDFWNLVKDREPQKIERLSSVLAGGGGK